MRNASQTTILEENIRSRVDPNEVLPAKPENRYMIQIDKFELEELNVMDTLPILRDHTYQ